MASPDGSFNLVQVPEDLLDRLEAHGMTAETPGIVGGRKADAAFTGRLVEAMGWHRHWARPEVV